MTGRPGGGSPPTARLVALGILILGSGVLSQTRADHVLVERDAYLMGTRVHLATEAPSRRVGLSALDRMLGVLESSEDELSTWRETSLLGRLNQHPVGERFSAPPWLCELLAELRYWHEETDGAFDPAVGSLVEAWDLRRQGRIPSPSRLESARSRAGLELFEVDTSPCAVTRRSDVTIDAGGFGKGLALERLGSATLGSDGDWLADLGGQIAVGPSSRTRWPVALAHPRQRHRPVLELRLESGSLAVSGGSERDVRVEDVRVGHILDPRSGRPVTRAFSVAVWHERALVADILATALYVFGVDEGLAWAEARGIAACFLLPVASGSSSPSVQGVELSLTGAFRRRFL